MSKLPAAFVGDLVVKLLKDDRDGFWEHRERSGFRDKDGNEYWCEIGTTTDFCSVPRVPLAYEMLGNRARRAGAVHDDLYARGIVSREKADDLLYEMLLLDGVSACEAEQFRLAVRMFGASHYTPAPKAA